jgi:hypothetical protein
MSSRQSLSQPALRPKRNSKFQARPVQSPSAVASDRSGTLPPVHARPDKSFRTAIRRATRSTGARRPDNATTNICSLLRWSEHPSGFRAQIPGPPKARGRMPALGPRGHGQDQQSSADRNGANLGQARRAGQSQKRGRETGIARRPNRNRASRSLQLGAIPLRESLSE